MLKLPDNLTADSFLEQHWQKRPLFMARALDTLRPAITRNELGWLATLDDVESRLVFVDRSGSKPRYHAETGPFESDYLQRLPKRDWTLLVHDVEKHLPDLRTLFRHVPFIPDWRIDDLMVSFAAPGGGVGPHRDHYDVFLCQGVGIREWRFTNDAVTDDNGASNDLALVSEFAGEGAYEAREGDVLYLPPGAAHWGTAKRACMTYSIGMRAPEASELALALDQRAPAASAFYADADLTTDEAIPGYLSAQSALRASALLGLTDHQIDAAAEALGTLSTQPKDWLRPDAATAEEARTALRHLEAGGDLGVHGMALIAFDDRNLYVNGSRRDLPEATADLIKTLCATRSIKQPIPRLDELSEVLGWMLQKGAFEMPDNS